MCTTAGMRPVHAPGRYEKMRLTIQIRLTPLKGKCIVNTLLDGGLLARVEKVEAGDSNQRFLPRED
jgi:hypothetical protein